ncbi:MAG: hypothetical protein HN348_12050 [Proteobacteria bacterium]|jgi:hypothetical protein|nr:hypothetical protein [Pseudomonadota bacterium]
MVRFDEYNTLIRVCRRLFIRNVHFRDGMPWDDYFKTESKALIVASHGPIIGPFLWVMALFPRIVDEGYGHLTYSAISHPLIRNIPVFARMVGYEKRGGRRLRTDDYIALFESGKLNILSVAPEGEYSLYGNGLDIQPFRSPRSLEIALRANCRIVLMVACGFERWQRNVSIGSGRRKRLTKAIGLRIPFVNKLDEQALEAAHQLSVSGMFGRIHDIYIASELYEPELTAADLAGDRATRDEQLWVEANRMRQQMIRMVDALKAEAHGGAGPRCETR